MSVAIAFWILPVARPTRVREAGNAAQSVQYDSPVQADTVETTLDCRDGRLRVCRHCTCGINSEVSMRS